MQARTVFFFNVSCGNINKLYFCATEQVLTICTTARLCVILIHVDGNGLVQCTQVQSVEELFVSLEDVTKWKELGEQLKIGQDQISQIHVQNNSVSTSEKTKTVLRYTTWYTTVTVYILLLRIRAIILIILLL